MVPGQVSERIEADRLERFWFATPFAVDKWVLDTACGVGCGQRQRMDLYFSLPGCVRKWLEDPDRSQCAHREAVKRLEPRSIVLAASQRTTAGARQHEEGGHG